MKILITGGAGFIGSHLCRRLLAQGNLIICADNFITGREDNIKDLLSQANFKLITHDICEPLYIKQDLDWVMHFASPASPNPNSPFGYLNLPIRTLKAVALGTHNSLGVARSQNTRFILASTSEIYGDPLEHPQTEEYWGHVNPIGPRGVYDEAKRFAEAITMAYHRTHGVETRIARIFNTYGPRMRIDDGRALPSFLLRPAPRPIW